MPSYGIIFFLKNNPPNQTSKKHIHFPSFAKSDALPRSVATPGFSQKHLKSIEKWKGVKEKAYSSTTIQSTASTIQCASTEEFKKGVPWASLLARTPEKKKLSPSVLKSCGYRVAKWKHILGETKNPSKLDSALTDCASVSSMNETLEAHDMNHERPNPQIKRISFDKFHRMLKRFHNVERKTSA